MDLPSDELAALRAESKRIPSLAIVIVFTAVSSVIVTLRYATRFAILKQPGLEDYMIGVALVASVSMTACTVEMINSGLGRHLFVLTSPQLVNTGKFLFATIILQCISLTFTKISILVQYRRIFPMPNVRRAINASIFIIIAFGVQVFFTTLFACIPIRAFWEFENQRDAKCLPKFPIWYTNVAFGITTDFLITLLPLPVFNQLKVSKKDKIILLVIFGFGFLVCIVSILRLHALTVLEDHMNDWTWYISEATYWSCIESNVSIVCGSLPTLKPLIIRFYPRFGTIQEYGNFDTSQKCCSNEPGLSINRRPFDGQDPKNTNESTWELQCIPGKSDSQSPSITTSNGLGNDEAEITIEIINVNLPIDVGEVGGVSGGYKA